MPTLFTSETIKDSAHVQDTGRLAEMESHELLRVEDGSGQIASFDQVRAVGRWFLEQKYSSVLPSSQTLPDGLFSRHEKTGNTVFMGKLALGPDAESQFPVTVESVRTPSGRDLRVHIVPIHFGALEVAQFGHHSDTLLALAAAAAVAPQFVLALQGGLETTQCATKKSVVTSITPDHGTPLAVTFDAFENTSRTLSSAIGVTGNRNVSIQQAAHLHGQSSVSAQQVSQSAAVSKIAAGVPIRTVLRSELPRHALFLPTEHDVLSGEQRIVPLSESLMRAGIPLEELSFLAAALGFTSQVVGDSTREQTVERILTPKFATIPLRELVTR